MSLAFRKGNRLHQGTALVEATMVIPLSLLIAFCSVQLGSALYSYYSLACVAYEGTRLASSTMGLEEGTFQGTSSNNSSPQQDQLRDKILTLAEKNGLKRANLSLKITYTTSGVNDHVVTVKIGFPFDFGIPVHPIQLSATASGPYLRRPL